MKYKNSAPADIPGWKTTCSRGSWTTHEYDDKCPNWYAFHGSVFKEKAQPCFASTTIKGNGRAKIDFGNCYTDWRYHYDHKDPAIVKVFLDDIEIASAGEGQKSVVKEFDFCDGMELKLAKEQWSTISFNSFEVLSCGNKCTIDRPYN